MINSYRDINDQITFDHRGETCRVCRHPHRNGGYGVWSETRNIWLFGGIEMNRKSLRCVQHWVLTVLGLPSVTSISCEQCGAPCDTKLNTGFADGAIERYFARCGVCGYNNSFVVDHRLALTDEEELDVEEERD